MDLYEVLEVFCKVIVLKLLYEIIRINWNFKYFIRDVFKLFKKGVDVKKVLDVEFEEEDGMDVLGLICEYLYLLMLKIRGGDGIIVLFEG